jgi:DMSO/TMAO reductase YedYZ molybdopterin-dependent catalytic subunit
MMTEGQGEKKSIFSKQNKTGMIALAVIVILLIAVPLGYLYTQGNDSDDTGADETLVTVVSATATTNVSLADLQGMTALTATSSYQNRFGNWRGLGEYEGVTLSDLADLVGGMQPGYIMTVTATDGYVQNLSYYQVYADEETLAIQGEMVLAFQFNGTLTPDWTDGPMVAVLAPDEALSNDDFNQTAARDPEFLTSTSAGSVWVKNVVKIEVQPYYDEWTVELTDLAGDTKELTRTKFVALDYTNDTYVVDYKLRNWTGVPVSKILGLVDDDDPLTFNATVADTQYRLQVIASDDYNKTMVAKDLVDMGAILAFKMNGTLLDEDSAPLKLVGSDLSGSSMVSMIASVKMLEPFILTLEYAEDGFDFTLSDLKAMETVTSSGGYMKSTGTIVGPNEFTGVPLKDFVEMVYDGMDYSLEVEATDGYIMTYSSSQVANGTFAYYDLDGTVLGSGNFTMLVAYEQDGAALDGMALRIAIVDESSPITDGHFWAKYVRYLRVTPYVADWNLTLIGVTTMTIDRQTFESIATCSYHALSYTFENETGTHVYTGAALWVLVAAVDGADAPDGHYLFNELLASEGYNVTVRASDGYSKTFSSAMVAGNDSMIIADRLDGEPLADDEFPLRLVGPWLSPSQMVGMVVEIELTDLKSVPDWNLTLVGTTTVVFESDAYAALFYCGIHAAWYNYTEDGYDYSYAGIPLWVLIGAIDGVDLVHYEFNDSLAAAGYTVRIIASDGYSVDIPIGELAYNDTVILAFMLNGTLLEGEEAPLTLVGEWLSGSQSVKSVVRIELIGLDV